MFAPVHLGAVVSPNLLIVTGGPASGQTTLARRLADDFCLPLFSKDDLKEQLLDSLGWEDGADSRRLGPASYDLLFLVARRLLHTGTSVILESNFYPDHGLILANLISPAPAHAIQILLFAQGPVLVERYRARDVSGRRHPGHMTGGSWEEVAPLLLDNPWRAPLPLNGPLIEIDTTDLTALNYPAIVASVRAACDQVTQK